MKLLVGIEVCIADLRIALLAISEGNAYSSAIQLLKRSAAKLVEMGQEVPRDGKSDASVGLASLYRELRSVSVKALLEGQAAAAATIANSLPRKLPRKRKEVGASSSKKAALSRHCRACGMAYIPQINQHMAD